MTSSADAASLLTWVRGKAWAMEQRALEAMTDALVALSRGQAGALEAARAAVRPTRPPPRSETGIAVLPVFGPISYRRGLFSMLFGGTVIKDLMLELQEAMDEPRVRSILMPIDSPGGTADGLIEIAAALWAARTRKRIVAVIDPSAASAAYWIASQASEIVSTPSGDAGSIGVFMLHMDFSKQMEQIGVKPTFVASTPEKIEANPFEPLSDDARADMKRIVNRVHTAFLSDVARGRGTDIATVREKFGRGRMIDARRARVLGMIDRIGTFDQALSMALGTQRVAATLPRPAVAPAGAALKRSTAPPHSQRRRRRRLRLFELS